MKNWLKVRWQWIGGWLYHDYLSKNQEDFRTSFFAQDGTKYLLSGDKSAGLVKLAK